MDFEKIEAQWDNPEFQKSFIDKDREPTSVFIERFKRQEAREKLWRLVRRSSASRHIIAASSTI